MAETIFGYLERNAGKNLAGIFEVIPISISGIITGGISIEILAGFACEFLVIILGEIPVEIPRAISDEMPQRIPR